MTLVEVVVAIVIAATAIVSSLIAYGQAERQHRNAWKRIEAARLADTVLATWYGTADGAPPLPASSLEPTEGTFSETEGGWKWRLSKIPSEDTPSRSSEVRNAIDFSLSKYRLEILSEDRDSAESQTVLTLELAGELVIAPRSRLDGR